MNEEKYTRDAKKESSRKKRVEPENKTRKKSHADKLKNETSAGESYRKKLRYAPGMIYKYLSINTKGLVEPFFMTHRGRMKR